MTVAITETAPAQDGAMDTKRRPYYSTKADWAAAKAAELLARADAMQPQPGEDWRARRGREEARSRIEVEAGRYRRLAEAFAKRCA